MRGGKALGDWGEAQVAAWLRRRGCTILASQFRCRYGEVDLIARKGELVCFVEVKTRTRTDLALPREYVDRRKQERLRTTAQYYLSAEGLDCPVRFDVAEVCTDGSFAPEGTRITYIENAF